MITFCYITSRKEPYFEWYCDSLYKQCLQQDFSDYEVIFVDGALVDNEGERRNKLSSIVNGRFKFRHVEPKPCTWRGRHRMTKKDYFAGANARNTAFCYSRGQHVVFCDDVSVLHREFVAKHMEAYHKRICMAGMQMKVHNLVVKDGDVISYDKPNKDSRVEALNDETLQLIPARDNSWLYGHNFSVPIQAALDVNGMDEIYDGQYGVEDCDFGIRLANAGHRIYFNQKCIVIESEEAHHTSGSFSHSEAKCINGRHANESVCLEASRSRRRNTKGNHFVLSDLRAKILNGSKFPITNKPFKDWRDGQSLGEM